MSQFYAEVAAFQKGLGSKTAGRRTTRAEQALRDLLAFCDRTRGFIIADRRLVQVWPPPAE
jgi:hypothetical protein